VNQEIENVRFDVVAAILLGILLPTLETVRRGIGHWSVSFTTMFEDYLAGAALIACAVRGCEERAARRCHF
jgi:hypothetical protein